MTLFFLVTVDYLVSQPKTIHYMLGTVELALQKKGAHDVFLAVGNMIIECIKYEQLCRIILRDPQLWKFFEFVKLGNFEISTESPTNLECSIHNPSQIGFQ